MDNQNGRSKRGVSPGKGLSSGLSSVSSYVLPSSPSSSSKALESPQFPQISTVAPGLVSPVKEHRGDEGKRGEEVEEEKSKWGWKSSFKSWCNRCSKEQKNWLKFKTATAGRCSDCDTVVHRADT